MTRSLGLWVNELDIYILFLLHIHPELGKEITTVYRDMIQKRTKGDKNENCC